MLLARKISKPTGYKHKVVQHRYYGSKIDCRGYTLENRNYDPIPPPFKLEGKPYIPLPIALCNSPLMGTPTRLMREMEKIK